MPGLKPTQAPAEQAPRARGFGRVRGTPTDMVVHALARCPACGEGLAGGTPSRTRQVIELKPRLAEVAEHVLIERVCPRCQRCWRPRADLARAVAGHQRLRIGPMGLIATLREPGGCCYARSVGTWSRGGCGAAVPISNVHSIIPVDRGRGQR
jgi:hypothetical protein